MSRLESELFVGGWTTLARRPSPAGRAPDRPAVGLSGDFPPKGKSTNWTILAILWALYDFMIFSLGRNPDFTQKIIWGGAACLILLTFTAATLQVRSRLAPEVVWLAGFALWALTGLMNPGTPDRFWIYFKLIIEMILLVWCISAVLRHSGGMKWFYWAFLAIGLYNVLVGLGGIDMAKIQGLEDAGRAMGITRSANSFGIYSFFGFLGALALLGERRPWPVRGLLLLAAGIGLFGVIASASKGAFMFLALTLILWVVLCFKEQSRHWVGMLATIAILAVVGQFMVPWLLENTTMGGRLANAAAGEEGSTNFRFELIKIGLRLFMDNPVFGVGLGRFQTASGTGYYAHNEWIEILSTTGFVGFVLFFSVYVVAWRRLGRTLRNATAPVVRYQIQLARLIMLILIVSGAVFRPNFLVPDTMFLLAIAVGTGLWAEAQTRGPGCTRPNSAREAQGRCPQNIFNRTRMPI